MQLGHVVGTATATVKHASLHGWRLLLVQLVDARGKPDGEPVLAIDSLGVAMGQTAILSSEGGAAREMMKNTNSPVRWLVVGIPDR